MRTAMMDSEIKIDKGIPIPRRTPIASRSVFSIMEIDDSCFMPGWASEMVHGRVKYLHPKKFSCRKTVEDGVKGVRIWRIA